MKQSFTIFSQNSTLRYLAALFLLVLPMMGWAQSPNIVISQVYGGGGSTATNPTPTFRQDYVELFNRSTTDQDVSGYTLQYGSATGTSSFNVASPIPAGTIIPAGRYYLVALGTGISGTPTGAALPVAVDFTPATTLNLAATAGRIALVNNSTPLTGASAATALAVVDFVGYGAAATYEGNMPVATLSTTAAAFRSSDGCTDTNQNNGDFVVATPAPRNSGQPKNTCNSPVLVVNPASLAFSAPAGQVANTATYTLTGYNLTGSTTYVIASSNAAVLVSATGAAGSFAQTISVTATGSTLSQLITVQFTAPATVGTTTAAISNSNGSLTTSVAVTGTAIMAYTWNAGGNALSSYSSASNWTPARTTPLDSDVLIFDGAVTPTPNVLLDYATLQTVGQLRFINNVSATLNTNDTRSLVLDGNLPGDDLVIGAGSVVTIANTAAAPTTTAGAGLTISLTSAETAAVSGTLVFAGYTGTTNGRHMLQATTTGAVQFLAGSTFQATATYSGTSPFGTATANANSVIFRNGARFEQYGGTSPFGTNTNIAIASFEPTSYFLFGVVSSSPALSGRTYGTLAYDIPGASNPTGADLLTIQGDLIITRGTVSINVTGDVALQGNVQVNGTSRLSFNPATPSKVQLNGTAAQTLGGNSTSATSLTFGVNATLQINNAAGVVLGTPITAQGPLQLTSGLLTTTTTNSLTLNANSQGGSNASFVNGPVIRPVSAAGSYIFPVGKGASFRPITLNVSAQNGTTYYRAEQFEGNPGQNVTGSDLTRVSKIRSYTITPFASVADAATGTATPPSGFTGTVMLSFGSNDGVTDPSQLVIAKRPNASSAWTNAGYTSGSATTSTVTSGVITSFSDFALGYTGVEPTTNPLPVVLTSFAATRQASGAVQVRWVTASEQRSAYFEVQRSLDGGSFVAVASVAAQGTTAQAHIYASLDTQASAGQLYYRLRQVDTDGTEAFSPVVALAATESASAPSVYPNPAQTQVAITFAAGEQVQLLDLAGRMLQATTLPASGQLNVEKLPAGTYLLRVALNGQPHILRFTKE